MYNFDYCGYNTFNLAPQFTNWATIIKTTLWSHVMNTLLTVTNYPLLHNEYSNGYTITGSVDTCLTTNYLSVKDQITIHWKIVDG